MTFLKENKTATSLVVILVAVIVFSALTFMNRNTLALTLWEQYELPRVALALNSSNIDLAMQLGNYYFGGGDYDIEKSEQSYRQAVAIDDRVLWGHYQLARILFVKGEFGEALKEINLELEANPENLRALYVRGLIYGYSGQVDEAILDFERFVEWAPKEWAGYNDLSWLLSKAGRYEEARGVINEALQNVYRGDENPWLLNSLGLAELNLGNLREARTAFSKALTFAGSLTEEEWQKSYPGNDPDGLSGGLNAFREAIGENLRRSTAK